MRKYLGSAAGALSVLLILFTLPDAGSAFGAESDYDIVAGNFLRYLGSDKEIASTQLIEGSALDPDLPAVTIGYLVNLSDGGYILISTSRRLAPVKAYSLKADFDTLPPAYRRYLLLETEFNTRTLEARTQSLAPAELGATEDGWDFLLNLDKMRVPLAYTPDTNLLTTEWDQTHPYNKFLPEIDGQKALAGCVNVAMGQVMKYYGHPLSGSGVYHHEWNGQQRKAVLYRPFNWANMPNVLGPTTPDYQADEVALLIRDLSVINETDLSLENSSSTPNLDALVENLGFSTNIADKSNSEADFLDTIVAEINAERPVLLSFPGHMTVADGYSIDETGTRIHVNMGWGGHADDYYYLDQTVQAGSYTFPTDPGLLTIDYHVAPCSGDDCYVNLEAQDGTDGFSITGIFDHQRDVDKYDVYLSGDTRVEGTRVGYAEQAFYISIYDTSGTLVASSKHDSYPIEQNLSDGRYMARVSLLNGSGSFYVYDENNAAYTVTISSGILTSEEKDAIDAAADVSPVIYNDFGDILLSSGGTESLRILIDARDENGDSLDLRVAGSNAEALQVALTGNILALTPAVGAAAVASRITVTATANGKAVDESFIVMVADGEVGFGKTFQVSGIFESQGDLYSHRVILDGNCTITGDNGYSSQGFYSSVWYSQDSVLMPPTTADDKTIGGAFSRGVYLLGASLAMTSNGHTYYYPYVPDGEHNEYALTVNCPDADDSTHRIAALLGIDLSGASLGDVNGDGCVDLTDAILAVQLVSGLNPSQTVYATGDVNGDLDIGVEEAIYVLDRISR